AKTPGRLEIADAPFVPEVGELGGLGDCLLHPAEAVNQTDLVGGTTVLYAPLCDLIDIGRSLVPRCGDDAEEAGVHRLDSRLDELIGRGRGALQEVGFAGERGRLHPIGANTQLLQRSLEAREYAEYADRAGDGRRLGVDEIR